MTEGLTDGKAEEKEKERKKERKKKSQSKLLNVTLKYNMDEGAGLQPRPIRDKYVRDWWRLGGYQSASILEQLAH